MLQAEETERARIETEKETERKKATEDLERWKDEQRQKAEEVGGYNKLQRQNKGSLGFPTRPSMNHPVQ